MLPLQKPKAANVQAFERELRRAAEDEPVAVAIDRAWPEAHAVDGRDVHARAGGGIVAESDSRDEVAETTTKFRTILTALGVS